MSPISRDEIPSGATRLYPILGDPIAQVKSPNGMTAGFAARGIDAACIPIHVTPGDLDRFIAGVSCAANVDGLIVTIPHKFACARHCASQSSRSAFLGAVNVMRRNTGGGWHGDMLDGQGFVAGARARGGEPRSKRALLIGAGGAGSAIGLALVEAGVVFLAVHDDDSRRRDDLIARLKRRTANPVVPGTADPTGYEFVANATPAGMRESDPLPVDVTKLAPTTFCGCVITNPLPSPWIAAASAIGCRTSDGVDMYQAQQSMMFDFFGADRGPC